LSTITTYPFLPPSVCVLGLKSTYSTAKETGSSSPLHLRKAFSRPFQGVILKVDKADDQPPQMVSQNLYPLQCCRLVFKRVNLRVSVDCDDSISANLLRVVRKRGSSGQKLMTTECARSARTGNTYTWYSMHIHKCQSCPSAGWISITGVKLTHIEQIKNKLELLWCTHTDNLNSSYPTS
jgi:hypothetical protein